MSGQLVSSTRQRPLAPFNHILFRHRLIWNPILVYQGLLNLEILFVLPCLRNRFFLIQTIVQATRTHHFMFRTAIHLGISSKSTILRSVGVRYTWLCFISEPHLHVQLFPKFCAQVAGNIIR